MIFMKVKGIPGSATAENYNGWIELTGINQKVRRNVSNSVGNTQNREPGLPTVGEFEISKRSDISSPHLFQQAMKGAAIPTVTIDVCHTGDRMRLDRRYTLRNVIISYIEDGAISSDSSLGNEFLRLTFTTIEKSHTPYDASGSMQSSIAVGYDLEKATAM